jgi:uncharacterized membrane protein YbhN (UPF0104 family)
LFAFIIYNSRDDFIRTLQTASPGYALGGLVLLFISRQIVAGRWYALLQTSEKPVKYIDALRLTYAGLFATNFLPTSIGGDLVRFVGMVQLGVDSALVLASLIMDRIVGMAGMSIMVPGGVYLLSHPIPSAAFTLSSPFAISASGFMLSMNKLWEKLLSFLRQLLKDILFWFRHPKNLFLSFFYTLIHETLIFGMFWLFLRSVGENVPFWVVASIYSLSYLLTLIPLSIGGLGIQEMSITYLYSNFGGVSLQGALALAVLSRLAFIINSLPGAFFLPSILRRQNEEKKSAEG